MSNSAKELNTEIIDDLQAILGDGFLEIVDEQLEQAREYLSELIQLITEGNARHCSLKAHSLKSSAGQVGMQGIQFLAKDLEESCRVDMESGEGISNKSRKLFDNLVREFDTAAEELKQYTSTNA